jgi:outer membrane protein assembly factor BamB
VGTSQTRRCRGMAICLTSFVLTGLLSRGLDAGVNPEEDWPCFLGPQANGSSRETGLIEAWPASGPTVLWDKAVGSGYSAPSVRSKRLVLHHRVGDQETVQCFEVDSGRPLWQYGCATEFVDPYGYNNGPRATPVLTTNFCYSFGAEGKLVCLSLEEGKLVWQRDTARDWTVPTAFFGVGSSPVLDGARLFVMVGGQPNAGMVALDARTGRTVWERVGERTWQGRPMTGWPGEPRVHWQTWEKQASYSTPVLAIIHGQRHLLCFMRQGLVSLDPDTGQERFSFWFRSRVNESVNAICPVVIDDLILLSAAYYKVGSVLLRVRSDGKGVDEVWRSTVLEAHWSTPVYSDGFVYAFSGRNEPDARFRCVDLRTGKLMWDRDERWAPHSTDTPDVFGRGSAILADRKLIALGEGGLLGLFKPERGAIKEVCRWQVPGLHYPCWTAPVLSEKRLYLRSEDRLVCLQFAR